jgi:hypothetical protein
MTIAILSYRGMAKLIHFADRLGGNYFRFKQPFAAGLFLTQTRIRGRDPVVVQEGGASWERARPFSAVARGLGIIAFQKFPPALRTSSKNQTR